MTPGGFDLSTAREVVGDGAARAIESKARQDADTGRCEPPFACGDTYWDAALAGMRTVIYNEQHAKRRARIARTEGKT